LENLLNQLLLLHLLHLNKVQDFLLHHHFLAVDLLEVYFLFHQHYHILYHLRQNHQNHQFLLEHHLNLHHLLL
jgi:hypothetical protein